MITIAEHTIEETLLSRDSKVLDLGCRYFGWSKAMLQYVDKVYCVDADSDIVSLDDRLLFYPVAITDGGCGPTVQYFKFGNGTGNFIRENNESRPYGAMLDFVPVETIKRLSDFWQVEFWDLVKMDIEGSEYDVLMNLNKPFARQLSFELHEHTEKKRGEDFIKKMFIHLQQWYDLIHVDYSRKHGLCENYWDVLAVLKK